MLRKRVTTILYGSDRNIWAGGAVQLDITDLFAAGGPRRLHHGDLQHATVDLNLDLPFDAGQVYGLLFSVPQHRPAWHLLRREDFLRGGVEYDEVILRLMLIPDAPGTGDLSNGHARLERLGSPFVRADGGVDDASFQALADPAKMVLMNVEAKCRETAIDSKSLLSFVRAVEGVAVDRVFLALDATLKPLLSRSKDFAAAKGHGASRAFPTLPTHPDSWKHTQFAAGNLQLSFSANATPYPMDGMLVHSVDVDVDLGRGLAHAREWLENNVFRPGHKTNQMLVYGLLYEQNILPPYTLDPVGATTRAATRLVAARVPRSVGGRRARTTKLTAPRRRAARTRVR
jgi:hypothetical protein